MNTQQPPPLPPDIRKASRRALWWGLGAGFLPSVMSLTVFTAMSEGWLNVSSKDTIQSLSVIACFFAMACSVASCIILFKRFNKGVALAGGVLLLLVNACVAFFFGCAAILQF